MSDFIKAPRGAYVMSYEEVPQEDLFEDGELTCEQVEDKIISGIDEGVYLLIRRTDRHLDVLQKGGK